MKRSRMQIRGVIDLSISVDERSQVYPGDPVVELRSATRIETDGFNVLSIALGSHTGTHVDAPYHFVADGPRLGELDLGLFAGPGVIVDVTGHEPRQPIVWSDIISVSDRLTPGTILVLRTGWSEAHLRTDRYFDHPYRPRRVHTSPRPGRPNDRDRCAEPRSNGAPRGSGLPRPSTRARRGRRDRREPHASLGSSGSRSADVYVPDPSGR
jgi:hypothetical protein